MINNKQINMYKCILKEITTNLKKELVYGSFALSLFDKKGELVDKIKAYHIFFKLVCNSFPKEKNLIELNHNEFNNYLEDIRTVLADNGYVLKYDSKIVISENIKPIGLNYFIN